MVEIDGIEYAERTPLENAYDMISYINQYCADNDIKNSKGELVQIDTNPGNPLYMLLFGFAYLLSVIQRLIVSAANSLNIGRASNSQLLNLAEIANVRRRAATKTTMEVFVNCPEDAEGDCIIDTYASISYSSGDKSLILHPISAVTIEPGTGKNIVLEAEDYTQLTIPEGTLEGFDAPILNLGTFYNYAAIAGHDVEEIASLRSRIQRREDAVGRIDRCINALLQLPGVVHANIYYNFHYERTYVQGGISVPPRHAALFVQGYNEDIARTFYCYMSCLTVGEGREDVITQNYVTQSGQFIPVYIIPPTFIPIHIKISLKNQIADSLWWSVQAALQRYIAQYVVSQELYATDVIRYLYSQFPDLDVTQVTVKRMSNPREEEDGNRIFTRPFELLQVVESEIVRVVSQENIVDD